MLFWFSFVGTRSHHTPNYISDWQMINMVGQMQNVNENFDIKSKREVSKHACV